MYNSHGNDRALFQAVGPGSDGVDFLIDIQFFMICDLDFFLSQLLSIPSWYYSGLLEGPGELPLLSICSNPRFADSVHNSEVV